MWPFSTECRTTYSPKDVHSRTFDYVIVGGGTAGCVIAARLTEDPSINVLLIDRGPIVDTWTSRVPLLSLDFRAPSSPIYRWKSSSDALFPSGESLIAGKVLGGSSKVNAHVYTRAVPGEYNGWSEAGRKGWDWDTVEPYFRKSEASLTHGSVAHRGSEGPWKNRVLPEIAFSLSEKLLTAADSLGIPRVPDLHDPSAPPNACGCLDVTVDEAGRRVSTFDSFLPVSTVNSRTRNLFICPSTIVCKLDLQSTSDGLKAQGVYMKPDSADEETQYHVSAASEVIMCAGAIATPQILMLSGIGPAEHLQSLGITVKKDLPGVGSNLKDHPCTSISYKVPRSDTLHNLETGPLTIVRELSRYVFSGRGLLLSPNPQIVMFALSKLLSEDSSSQIYRHQATDSSKNARSPANVPDLELTLMPYGVFDESPQIDQTDGVATLVVILLKPKSSGTVRLTSLDARDRPVCDLRYLTHSQDVAVLRKGLRLSLALGGKCCAEGYPLRDLRVPQSESEKDLDEHIRNNVRTTFHYSCTCRMAPEEEGGVVDDALNVHGVRGLRVADASVFPDMPAAHPQAPVVMIAERCADFIKESRTR